VDAVLHPGRDWVECDITHQAVDKILQQTAELPKVAKPTANHLTDFDAPGYNVWKFRDINNLAKGESMRQTVKIITDMQHWKIERMCFT